MLPGLNNMGRQAIAPVGGYVAEAWDNQGTQWMGDNTYSGGAASKTGIGFLEFFFDGVTFPANARLLEFRDAAGNIRFDVRVLVNGQIDIQGKNAANTIIFRRLTQTGVVSELGWHNLLWAHDLLNTTGELYIDNSQITSFAASTTTNDLIAAFGRVGVFAGTSGSSIFDGYMSQVFDDSQTFADITSSVVRANFINQSTGKPEDLTGYLSPQLLLQSDFTSITTNSGSADDLALSGTGSFIEAATGPSD